MKKRFIYFIIIFIFILLLLLIFYFLTRKTYTNDDFNIPNIKSNIDYDNDGIDDYTDIYLSALDYVKTKPKYKSKYYNGGFPNDNFGVCTDVVAFAFLNAGYNLRDLVDEDIRENMELSQKEVADILKVSQPTYSRWEKEVEIIPLNKLISDEFCTQKLFRQSLRQQRRLP